MKNYIFFSGEFSATMPAVFKMNNWHHTMSARKLFLTDGKIHREKINEHIDGCVYYCRTENYDTELHNLKFLMENCVPCYPNPAILQRMSDRHKVMQECIENNFIDHPVLQGTYEDHKILPFPFVIKTGQEHQGQGKFLVNNIRDYPKFDDIATIEPFFIGASTRVLLIGNDTFGIKFDNDTSWIKNSAGADTEICHPSIDIVLHAKKLCKFFNLDIAGVDYIVEPNGKFHFLEINQFPGIDISESAKNSAIDFFVGKMKEIESI
jgi:glutathione synthase/RimK-type ligase-like ATP-grasp enzyme